MPLAELPDGRIDYQRNGDGPILLLLTPQSASPAGRGEMIKKLSKCHTVVTFHPRGAGKSSAMPENISIRTMAEDVIALAQAIDIKKFSIACHSTGCGVGLALAVKNPEMVDSIVLAAPWSYADSHLTTMQNLRVAASRVLEPTQYSQFNSAILFPPEFRRVHQEEFDLLARNARTNPHNPSDIESKLHAILDFDARPLLSRISHKTLVATSKDDQLMPPWFAREIAAGIAGSIYVEFEQGGHMFPETLSDQYTKTILEFLNGAASGESPK